MAVEFRNSASVYLKQDLVKPEENIAHAKQAAGKHMPPNATKTKTTLGKQKKAAKTQASKKAAAPPRQALQGMDHMETKKSKTIRKSERAYLVWKLSSGGASCDSTCAAEGMTCDEAGMAQLDTESELTSIAAQVGLPCTSGLFVLTSDFPFHVSGQCAYSRADYSPTCQLETCSAITRYCSCQSPHADGDPHLTNLHGESFDIMREGINVLLLLPRKAEEMQNTKLRVEASVEHPGDGSKCTGFFIVRLWIKGLFVGEDLEISTTGWDHRGEDSLAIKVGSMTLHNESDVAALVTNGKYSVTFNDKRSSMTMKHPKSRVHFANLVVHVHGVDLQIDWSTGRKKPNSLGFRATHLSELGQEWGGILGVDDHSWVSTHDPECGKTEMYPHIPQLIHVEHQEMSSASASLA